MRSPVYRDMEEEMLEKVYHYLLENGLDHFSMREFCKSTGISMGSTYYWFRNKEQMIAEAAEYGLSKLAEHIFGEVFEQMEHLDTFFSNILERMEYAKPQLRLLARLATSPVYGERMRKAATLLDSSYISYINEIANRIGCETEAVAPLVYLCVSVLVDYSIWEDKAVSQMQCDYICKQLQLLYGEQKKS